MNVYRVSFIGHRHLERISETEKNLKELISDLISQKEFVIFQMGREGDFDVIAAACVKEVQNRRGEENSELALVLPYVKSDIEYYKAYYDDIIIPTEKVYFKAAIKERNKWLVENSDLLIAHVKTDSGGAADCVKFAQRSGLPVIFV